MFRDRGWIACLFLAIRCGNERRRENLAYPHSMATLLSKRQERSFKEKSNERARFRTTEKREKKREPLSWHPVQRVQNDAEAGRGESLRTAPRYGGGVAWVWWEEGAASSGRTGLAGPVPRSNGVGVQCLSLSLLIRASFSAVGRGDRKE